MVTLSAQQAGGRTRAISSRQEALEKYYKNPNFCKYCGEMIRVKNGEKIAQVRIRKFCNRSCAAKFNNPLTKIAHLCPVCGKEISPKAITCRQHQESKYIELGNTRTKGELFVKRNGYQSARSTIRKHAYKVFENNNKPKKCVNCGYDKYIDVAHIKSVASFDDSATLGEINNINNLVGLCPNCHWEFDNGMLKL